MLVVEGKCTLSSTVTSRLSTHPFKYASRLSTHFLAKKLGFNTY